MQSRSSGQEGPKLQPGLQPQLLPSLSPSFSCFWSESSGCAGGEHLRILEEELGSPLALGSMCYNSFKVRRLCRATESIEQPVQGVIWLLFPVPLVPKGVPWAGGRGQFEVSPAQDPGLCFSPYDHVVAGRPQEGAGPVPSAGSGASCCGICTHNAAAASAADRVGTACSGIAAEVTQCAAAQNGSRAINNEECAAINSRMQAHTYGWGDITLRHCVWALSLVKVQQ